MTGPPISLCVINHNGMRYLPDCLMSVATARRHLDEIILVDDASTDESVQYVASRFPWVRIKQLPTNSGPAAARNVGLQEARSDLVMVIDNDVRIPADGADRMRTILDQYPRAAVAMAQLVYADRPDVVQFAGAHAHFTGLQVVEPNGTTPQAALPNKPIEIGSLITACFMVDRRRLGRDVEFDDTFFIYLEDHDFGLRVRARGHEIVTVPDVVCLHGEGTESLSIREVGGYTKRRVFFLIRNRWQVLLKDFSLRSLIILFPVLALYEAAQVMMVLKKGWLSEWLRALRWIFSNRRQIVAKRRLLQRSRVVRDRVLLEGGPIPFRSELTQSALERAAKKALDGVTSMYWALVWRVL